MKDIVLGIRPEHILLSESGEFSGVIDEIEFLGDKNIFKINFLNQSLTITSQIYRYKIGDSIRFNIIPEEIHIFDNESSIRINSK